MRQSSGRTKTEYEVVAKSSEVADEEKLSIAFHSTYRRRQILSMLAQLETLSSFDIITGVNVGTNTTLATLTRTWRRSVNLHMLADPMHATA